MMSVYVFTWLQVYGGPKGQSKKIHKKGPHNENNKNSTSISEDDHTSCLNGYVTVSPITMSILKEPNFEKLKKVNF